MKYTPNNPNEHKFKPLMAKLKGFQKKQPRQKKKKNKTVITITTNKMSIMDILFSGQKFPQLQGLMRQSYFNSLCYQCQPKFYGFEYIIYKFDIKWPKQQAYELDMLEASLKSRCLKSSIHELLDYNLRDVELTERFIPTSMYPNPFTGGVYVDLNSPVSTISGFDSDVYHDLKLTYEPYSEYDEINVRYRIDSPVYVIDDMLLAEDIVQVNNSAWTKYCIMEMCRQMKYLLLSTASNAGVDVDKWKHDMDLRLKREHMLVFA